jgi:hypothetical protein
MDSRPWITIHDQDQVEPLSPQQVWVRLQDLMSTQCFAPACLVPGLGPADPDAKVTDQGLDESSWRCKPGDLVMVCHSPWHAFDDLTADMKKQLGRIGIVLEREAGEYGLHGWHWAVLSISGRNWSNEYSVSGQCYSVEERVMLVHNQRLLPLAALDQHKD